MPELIIDQGADYLITIKGRNAKIHTAAQEPFADDATTKPKYETVEKGHGREEKEVIGAFYLQ